MSHVATGDAPDRFLLPTPRHEHPRLVGSYVLRSFRSSTQGFRRFTTPEIASADRMTKWGRFISRFHWSKTTEPLTPPSHDALPPRGRRARRAEIASRAPREEPRFLRSEMPSLERTSCPHRSVSFPTRMANTTIADQATLPSPHGSLRSSFARSARAPFLEVLLSPECELVLWPRHNRVLLQP